SRADLYILFSSARGVRGQSVFHRPRHQAVSKKSSSSSREVGGCISCDQRSVIFSIDSSSFQIGSIGTTARRIRTKVRRGKPERSRPCQAADPIRVGSGYHPVRSSKISYLKTCWYHRWYCQLGLKEKFN